MTQDRRNQRVRGLITAIALTMAGNVWQPQYKVFASDHHELLLLAQQET